MRGIYYDGFDYVRCQHTGCIRPGTPEKKLQHELLSIMDCNQDSLRFYYLGNQYRTKIEHFGAKTSYEPEGALII